MRARLLAVGCVVAGAACGDNQAVAVDGAIDGSSVAPACAAAFSENFTESWVGPANCGGIEPSSDGHTMLRFTIPARTIDAQFEISFDLGVAPEPGTYTAQNFTTSWSASALHEFDMTSCLYHAGTAAVPPGTFRLVLDAIDAHAHGQLDLMLYVLARPYTYCGETNIERLAVTF